MSQVRFWKDRFPPLKKINKLKSEIDIKDIGNDEGEGGSEVVGEDVDKNRWTLAIVGLLSRLKL